MRLTTKRCHTLHFQWQANVRVSSHFHLAPVSPIWHLLISFKWRVCLQAVTVFIIVWDGFIIQITAQSIPSVPTTKSRRGRTLWIICCGRHDHVAILFFYHSNVSTAIFWHTGSLEKTSALLELLEVDFKTSTNKLLAVVWCQGECSCQSTLGFL